MKKNGFSLIELMVSMSIMAIIFTLATPSYSSWLANIKLKNNAESINIGILQARAEAIRRNSTITFELNTLENSWKIVDENTNKIINEKQKNEFLSSKSIEMVTIPEDSKIISFDGSGIKKTDINNQIEQIDIKDTNLANSDFRILVGKGGSSLICLPMITDQKNYRYCRSQ